jgi:hypothetical protein
MKARTDISKAAPVFERFEWLSRADQKGPYDLLSNVRDLAAGASVIMAMIEQSDMDADNEEAPLFNQVNRGRLLRMSIAAMATVEVEIERHFNRLANDGENLRASAVRAAP